MWSRVGSTPISFRQAMYDFRLYALNGAQDMLTD